MIALERVWRLNKLSLTALWVLLKNPVATIIPVIVSTPGDFRTGVGLPTMGQSQVRPSTQPCADGRQHPHTQPPGPQRPRNSASSAWRRHMSEPKIKNKYNYQAGIHP